MTRRKISAETLTKALQSQQVLRITSNPAERYCIHFSNGTSITVDADSLELNEARTRKASGPDQASQPTQRQLEYLQFIAKYIQRFGRAPAEADIERHFMVAAPSVHQMMKTLERRGFISRQRGVARSIRICIDLADFPIR